MINRKSQPDQEVQRGFSTSSKDAKCLMLLSFPSASDCQNMPGSLELKRLTQEDGKRQAVKWIHANVRGSQIHWEWISALMQFNKCASNENRYPPWSWGLRTASDWTTSGWIVESLIALLSPITLKETFKVLRPASWCSSLWSGTVITDCSYWLSLTSGICSFTLKYWSIFCSKIIHRVLIKGGFSTAC